MGHLCYAGLGLRMHPRTFVFITLLVLCHLQVRAQVLTNALPPENSSNSAQNSGANTESASSLPDDPGQEVIPVAQPEAASASGTPVRWEAHEQTRVGDIWTLTGNVVLYYRDYIFRADKITYHQPTSEIEAEGHLQVT